eukprot:scaffold2325_cov257-Pinguiococcus_pyrenoidosus.AAC.4
MSDRVLLVVAEENDTGELVAGALNLIGEDCIYGRNWGCSKQYDSLHFECCYYQAIEAAIELGIDRVEAGAQGEHKIRRGYLPTLTYSAHYLADGPGPFISTASHALEKQRQCDLSGRVARTCIFGRQGASLRCCRAFVHLTRGSTRRGSLFLTASAPPAVHHMSGASVPSPSLGLAKEKVHKPVSRPATWAPPGDGHVLAGSPPQR